MRHLEVVFRVGGPYLSADSLPCEHGVDAVQFRSGGQYRHPGSQWRGRLLDACRRRGDGGKPVDPARLASLARGLRPEDLDVQIVEPDAPGAVARARPPGGADFWEIPIIAVDRVRGVVADGMFGRVRALRPGCTIYLKGGLWLEADSDLEMVIHGLIALRDEDGLGQNVDQGWGWIHEVVLAGVTLGDKATSKATADAVRAQWNGSSTTVGRGDGKGVPVPVSAPAATDSRRMALRLTFRSPIYAGQRARRGNLVHALDYLPGGVFKRAMADAMAGRGQEVREEWFSSLRVLHAFPLRERGGSSRPAPIPLVCSQYPTDKGHRWDDLFSNRENNAPGGTKSKPAPIGRPWVESKEFGSGSRLWFDLDPSTEIAPGAANRVFDATWEWRGHNTHDPETRATTENGRFLRRTLAPCELTTTLEWTGGPTESEFLDWLQQQVKWVGGECNMGFGQIASISPITESTSISAADGPPENSTCLDIALATDALLLSSMPDGQQGASHESRVLGPAELSNAYAVAFQSILGADFGAITDFYASHQVDRRRVGGVHLQPVWVTQAGSSFRLKVKSASAAWDTLRKGIIHAAARDEAIGAGYPAGPLFPFEPSNGYGEVVLLRSFRVAGGAIQKEAS